MPSDDGPKERLIKNYRDKVDALRQQLEPLEAGEQSTSSDGFDATAKDIAQIKAGIAEYERVIAALEKQVRAAR
jgi:septal ring factor EnvC (AmiA/AmiB activator)